MMMMMMSHYRRLLLPLLLILSSTCNSQAFSSPWGSAMILHRPAACTKMMRMMLHLDDDRSTLLLLLSSKGRHRRHFIDSGLCCLYALLNHENREESWEEESSAPSQMNENDDDDDSIRAMVENDDDDDDDDESSFQAIDDDDNNNEILSPPLLEEYRSWSEALTKAQKALQKKQTSLQNELQKVQQVESTVARAQLLTAYLYKFSTPGVNSCVVQDWENDGKEIELTLDPAYESASAEADALFQQARKLKRGSTVVKTLLEETTQAIEMLNEMQTDLESSILDAENENVDEDRLRLVQDRLLRTSQVTNFQPPASRNQQHDASVSSRSTSKEKRHPRKKPEIGSPASNIRKLQSAAGCTILVGRNRRGNEYLSTVVARDKDIWMHARGTPGAHVVILQRRGGGSCVPATAECWQLAANLAAFYSDHRSERKTAVTAVQPKHIIKPRNAPLGAVQVREEWRVLTGFPDDVPDELKQAREASGQLEDYRAADKAKLRKRNKQSREKEKSKAKAKKQQQRLSNC